MSRREKYHDRILKHLDRLLRDTHEADCATPRHDWSTPNFHSAPNNFPPSICHSMDPGSKSCGNNFDATKQEIDKLLVFAPCCLRGDEVGQAPAPTESRQAELRPRRVGPQPKGRAASRVHQMPKWRFKFRSGAKNRYCEHRSTDLP